MDSAFNPNPAGGLKTTGIEYMRFMMLQLRKGLDGTTRLLPESLIDEQRKDQFSPSSPKTTISYSPYQAAGLQYHYGLGNWRECATPDNPGACDAALRVSSTGTYGWAPWIDVQENYAAIIMTKQPLQGTIIPSEDLKVELSGLIPGILAGSPPVIRAVP
jgi:CubicO group peptidase (beta-lactamase class C family)